MIEIQKLRKEYTYKGNKNLVLDNISLHIKKGEICGIIGKSGAGKSTLIRCINLLEKPSDGSIIINNTNMIQLSEKKLAKMRQSIGMIFQHFNLLNSRTVYENISFPLEIQGIPTSERTHRITELLNLTGLSALMYSYPDQLSGGQKQRVAIARALATNPKVLLSDEATSALDPETTKEILHLMKDINQKLNVTIVLITHEMEVVREVCDNVAILSQGKVIEYGEVTDVFLHPQSDITKKMINSTMKLNLPDYFLKKLTNNPYEQENSIPVVKIAFLGKRSTQPLVVNLYKHCNITANIIQANIEQVHGESVGITICTLQGTKSEWENALNYINNNNYQFEVLGYVKPNV